jgi:hypothetical protein
MQNARSTAAISRASEGYHFSHDALVTCKLPISPFKSRPKMRLFVDICEKLASINLFYQLENRIIKIPTEKFKDF